MQKSKVADACMLVVMAVVGILVVLLLMFLLTYLFGFIADNVTNGYAAIVPAAIIIGAGMIALALRLKN